MKKILIKLEDLKLYHFKDNVRIEGKNDLMFGDCSSLRGDCSNLIGNCGGLSGNCSGLRGECSNVRGDFDDCEITDEERKRGVNIVDLIE